MNYLKSLKLLLAFLLAPFTFAAPLVLNSVRVQKLFDEYDNARKQMHVPGMGMVIIAPTYAGGKDRNIHLKTFGVRSLKTGEPFDENTLHRIASTTKLFTAFATGILVDQGQLKWETPISDYVRVNYTDPELKRQINLLDLLSHRTGFNRHDSLAKKNIDHQTMFELYEKTKPMCGLRKCFIYSNLMVNRAATLANHALRIDDKDSFAGWRYIVKNNILDRLNMNSAVVDYQSYAKYPNVATPHIFSPVTNTTSEYNRTITEATLKQAPADGGLAMSLSDFGKWLSFLLPGAGAPEVSIVSQKTRDMIFTVHNNATLGDKSALGGASYGLGVFVLKYRGKRLHVHGGDLAGQKTLFCVFPDDNVASTIFWNGEITKKNDLCYDFADQFIFQDDISNAGSIMRNVTQDYLSNGIGKALKQNDELVKAHNANISG